MNTMIEIVSATRHAESDFWKASALGISLRRLARDTRLVANIAFQNHLGLPEIFNARIDAAGEHDILVFIHDDVWIDDYFLADRLIQGLDVFDIIGVAGNRRRVPNQPAWLFIDDKLTMDAHANLSGSIAHGSHPFGPVSMFGACPSECELLDGVLIAAKKSRLQDASVRFDPRFDFHFYDMDFCRQARSRGLRLGTWPVCLTHQSKGEGFNGAKWREKLLAYREKWKE